MMSITEQYLKNAKGEYTDAKGNVVDESKKVANPAYCSKLKVVTTTDAEMAAAAQTAFQNVLTSNPNVKVVLCCTGDGAGAVSQIYMDEKLSADDYAKIGVFGCGFIG
jgi:ABC-type sugar transport system substrate-binding protein